MDAALERRLQAFGRDPAATELTGALLVAGLLDPQLDERRIRADLAALGDRCGARTPWAYLAAYGFRGNAEEYEGLDNSHIGRVLETGLGLPITLAVVLVEVAHAAGRAARGINFPGHFLARVDDQLVDPFAMSPVRPEDCVARLPAADRGRPLAELFVEASAQAVALRMLNNLKGSFAGRALWHRALEAVDAQLAIAPEQPGLQLERGEFWLRLGSVAAARACFAEALALADRSDGPVMAALTRHLRQRLASLGDADDVMH